MLLLALDTATATTTVALLDSDRPIAERHLASASHSRTLLPAIEELLRDAGRTPRSLEAIAVGRGPGSFTGVRIGVTLAKSLAYALNIPLVGVSTLRALAHNVRAGEGEWIGPCLDALKGQVYGAIFRPTPGGMETIRPEKADVPGDFAEALKAGGATCRLLGSGVLRYRDLFRSVLGAALTVPDSLPDHQPSAIAIGRLAWERLARGESDDVLLLEPDYCRPSEAELNRKTPLPAPPATGR